MLTGWPLGVLKATALKWLKQHHIKAASSLNGHTELRAGCGCCRDDGGHSGHCIRQLDVNYNTFSSLVTQTVTNSVSSPHSQCQQEVRWSLVVYKTLELHSNDFTQLVCCNRSLLFVLFVHPADQWSVLNPSEKYLLVNVLPLPKLWVLLRHKWSISKYKMCIQVWVCLMMFLLNITIL